MARSLPPATAASIDGLPDGTPSPLALIHGLTTLGTSVHKTNGKVIAPRGTGTAEYFQRRRRDGTRQAAIGAAIYWVGTAAATVLDAGRGDLQHPRVLQNKILLAPRASLFCCCCGLGGCDDDSMGHIIANRLVLLDAGPRRGRGGTNSQRPPAQCSGF